MILKALIVSTALLSTTAYAADRTVVITDDETKAWANVPSALDRCIGAMVIRRDAGPCQDLAPFLNHFAEKIAAPPAAPAPAPAPVAPPAPGGAR